MVARDGIEPPPPAFQDRLASELSGLESADFIDMISVAVSSIQDGLGPLGVVSTVRWSCIGRAGRNALWLPCVPSTALLAVNDRSICLAY